MKSSLHLKKAHKYFNSHLDERKEHKSKELVKILVQTPQYFVWNTKWMTKSDSKENNRKRAKRLIKSWKGLSTHIW